MRQDWGRFLRAIDYIEDRLGSSITIREVSAAAFYSKFHFSRMFRAVVGQSIMSYAQQRRLSSAAARLRSSDEGILGIALDHGFGSQEAFTRAFKRAFGATPGSLRRMDRPSPHLFRAPFSRRDLLRYLGGKKMKPKIVRKEAFRVVGLEARFDSESTSDIPKLWDRLHRKVHAIRNRKGYQWFGICESPDPKIDRFTYTAAVEVEDANAVPRGLVTKTVPASRYAVFTHKVKSKNLSKDLKPTLQHIWGTWLPNSSYEFAGTPDFELYDERFNGKTMSGEFDLYVPIRAQRFRRGSP